jgi:tetratricopeptide (TPR) repeat protein
VQTGLVITIIILGIGIGLVAYFLIRSILKPRRVETLQNLLKQNKTQAVIKAAKQMVTRDSRDSAAHYLLGCAYLAENRNELALMELRTVSQIGEFDGIVQEIPFRKKIAELYAEFNQTEEALKEYLVLIRREPESSEHHYRAGRLFEERSNSEKALEYYRKSVQLDPRNAEARSRIGLLLYRAKKPVEARAELDAAVRANPDDYQAWFYIGKLLKDSRDCIAALSAFEKSSRDPAFKVRSLIERGGCLISVGQMQRAIAELARASELADDDATEALYARYFLAHAYERTRSLDQAIEQWEFIFGKKPGFRDVAEKLARYQDLRADDRMKDYLTLGPEEFESLCRRATEVLGLTVRDTRLVDGGCEVVGVEPVSKWRNVRSMPTLLRFLRYSDMIAESTVRDVHEAMKKQSINKGLLLTSSSFSRKAEEYAGSRPIDLYGKSKLQALLQKVEF